jgi:cyclase
MQRTRVVRISAFAIALGGLWFAWTQQPPKQPLQLEKVADDLQVLSGNGGNVAIFTTSEGVILVDDKFAPDVPEILDNVKKVSDQPVRYILNTHQHGDHTGGNETLLKGAEILIQRNARANMVTGKQPGLPRITYSEEASVFLGGKEVRAHHYGRGHTNGDAVIYFPADRIVHTGDLFVAGAPFIDYANGGSAVEWPATIDKVLELDFDKVIPGHGPVMTKQDLLAWKKSFETVRERLTKLKREGKSKDEVAAALKFDDLPGWASGGRLWTRGIQGFYDEVK